METNQRPAPVPCRRAWPASGVKVSRFGTQLLIEQMLRERRLLWRAANGRNRHHHQRSGVEARERAKTTALEQRGARGTQREPGLLPLKQ